MTKNLTPDEKKFVAEARKLAEDNYENGGDVIVECYDDDDILKLGTLEEVKFAWEAYDEHRREIQSTAW